MKLYEQYRKWAAKFGQKEITLIGGAAGLVGLALVLMFGTRVVGYILPWFALFAAPIAALDAYGAATYRGKHTEGVIRGFAVLFIFWIPLAVYLIYFR